MKELLLADAIDFFTELAAVAEERYVGLEAAARIVKAEAKAEIGHYQEAAAPFGAWPELADSTKADRVAHGYPENEPLLRDGDLRDSIEHKVEGHTAYIGSDSDIAVYQELGTSRIPPRSFLGGALVRKTDEVVKVIGEEFVGFLIGEAIGRTPIE